MLQNLGCEWYHPTIFLKAKTTTIATAAGARAVAAGSTAVVVAVAVEAYILVVRQEVRSVVLRVQR